MATSWAKGSISSFSARVGTSPSPARSVSPVEQAYRASQGAAGDGGRGDLGATQLRKNIAESQVHVYSLEVGQVAAQCWKPVAARSRRKESAGPCAAGAPLAFEMACAVCAAALALVLLRWPAATCMARRLCAAFLWPLRLTISFCRSRSRFRIVVLLRPREPERR